MPRLGEMNAAAEENLEEVELIEGKSYKNGDDNDHDEDSGDESYCDDDDEGQAERSDEMNKEVMDTKFGERQLAPVPALPGKYVVFFIRYYTLRSDTSN